MLAPDQAGIGEASQRLLHGADADLVLRGELLFGGQAVALAPAAPVSMACDDGVGDALELGHGAVGAHRLLSNRLTAVSRTFSSSLVMSVPDATSAT